MDKIISNSWGVDLASLGASALQEAVKLTLGEAKEIWTTFRQHPDFIKEFASFSKYTHDMLQKIERGLPDHAVPVLWAINQWLRLGRECLVEAVSHRSQVTVAWNAKLEQENMSKYRARINELLVVLLLSGLGGGDDRLQLYEKAARDAEKHFKGVEQQLAVIKSKLNIIFQGKGSAELLQAVWDFQEKMSGLPAEVSQSICSSVEESVSERHTELKAIMREFHDSMTQISSQILGNQEEMKGTMHRVEEVLAALLGLAHEEYKDRVPSVVAEIVEKSEQSGGKLSAAQIEKVITKAIDNNTLHVTGCRVLQTPFTPVGSMRPVKMPCCGFSVSYRGAQVLASEDRCRFCSEPLKEYKAENERGAISITEDEACQAVVAAELMGLKPKVAERNDIDMEDQEEIAGGGEGQVFKGKFKGKDVAIKKIRRRIRSGVDEEDEETAEDKRMSDSLTTVVRASYLASMSSSNICKTLAVRWTKYELWILMELCKFTLEGFVKNAPKRIGRKGLHSVDVIALGLSLVDALEGLHCRAKFLHMDIKPGNIMFREAARRATATDPTSRVKKRVKLVDFGLATQLPTCVETTMITQQGHSKFQQIGGATFGYAPKEQLDGKGSTRTDVYSVGAVLKYAATGVHPYMEKNPLPGTVAYNVANGVQMEVPETIKPTELHTLILNATKPEVNDRPPLKVFKNELLRALSCITPEEFKDAELELPSLIFLEKSVYQDSTSGRQGTETEYFTAMGFAAWAQAESAPSILAAGPLSRKLNHVGKLRTITFNAFDSARPHRKITAIAVHWGHWIDGLEVQFDGQSGTLHGGRHSTNNQPFEIPEGAYLTKVVGKVSNQYVTMLQFSLSNGTVSREYGSNPGRSFEFEATEGDVISGIHGSLITRNDEDADRDGSYIGAFGVYTSQRPG